MKCAARTSRGSQCRARAVAGTSRCYLHTGANAKTAGSRGGRRRTLLDPSKLKTFKPPQSAGDVMRVVAQTLIDVRGAKIDVRTANAIAVLAGVLLRAFEIAELEQRLSKLEQAAHMRESRRTDGKY